MNGTLLPIFFDQGLLAAAGAAGNGGGGSFWVRVVFAAIVIAVVLGVSAVLSRGIDRLQSRSTVPAFLIELLRGLVKWGILVLALLLILHNFGVRIGGVWALVTTVLAMIAIGFVAVWSMLSNLMATVLILIFRPFEIGDYIEFVGEATKGKVSRLGLMYTTLDEDGASVLQIPNNIIFQRVIRRRHGRGTEELADSLRRETASEKRIDPDTAGVASPGESST